ncbi:MAG: hypothetical protein GSR85_07180 [Desulfurococcales archaeon]|nr:hypothetical protein [Desulfurococcales archaeon]
MSSWVILSTHSLDPDSLNLLLQEGVRVITPPSKRLFNRRSWILENVSEASILIAGFTRIDKPIIDGSPRLELIVSRSSGVDHIDVEYAESKGICVANQPEAIAEAVAEHIVGLIVSSLRRITKGHLYVVEGGWYENGFLRGVTLRGKTLGVVGMGRIGSLASLHLRMLGVSKVLYWSRSRKREVEQLLKAEPASLDRIFRESDVIVVTLPITRETKGIIGYELLSKMKENALIVNVGRGGVIDEDSLARVLRERSDILAALDVYEKEPLPPDDKLVKIAKETDRLVLTPHNAGGTDLSMKLTSLLAVKQVIHYINTGEVWNPVTSTCREARDIAGLWADF